MSDDSHQIPDAALQQVFACWRQADVTNERAAAVVRATFDQLYDGQHTGRYRWDQLYKTEKTHFGTLLEINLRREFSDVIDDGVKLDYRIGGFDIDCKYSQKDGGWMIPPEAFGELLLVATADDAAATWSLGMVRASEDHLRTSRNRDNKTQLNPTGRQAIQWLARDSALPPNVLLGLPRVTIDRIFAPKSGQRRLNELLRLVTNQRIGRNTIATVAQQDDYMKRVRSNGGSRSALAPEGYLIPGGDYEAHRQIARQLGAGAPEPGEVVSLRVVPTSPGTPQSAELAGQTWRLARDGEAITVPAPVLPDTKRQKPVM
ncbi:NaeI family type II restriction endonuclease [Leekyejoonella antrihumi]|uniref:Restriction endonuclease n=1 Tax=Leekyejoonella antrihumi TaxID=1660198 RepID=A0A563DV28_9MICO|nr:NaeI family type II restriction endonuclease [Leekyejoonella antrihumi]TWP34095.1 restriction endonuclease [Leekyejoonella antrihumi]